MAEGEWNRYAELVLHEITRAHKRLDKIECNQSLAKEETIREIASLRTDLKTFEATIFERARWQGAIAGGVTGIIVAVVGGLILFSLLGG